MISENLDTTMQLSAAWLRTTLAGMEIAEWSVKGQSKKMGLPYRRPRV